LVGNYHGLVPLQDLVGAVFLVLHGSEGFSERRLLSIPMGRANPNHLFELASNPIAGLKRMRADYQWFSKYAVYDLFPKKEY